MDDSTSNASSQSLASSFTLTASPPEMDTAEAIESQAKYPDPESITADTLTDHMYTAGCPPVDILIRTSGVERLSDFLLWQCHQDTSLIFLKCLWPEFDLWVFLPVLAEWQRAQRKLKEEKASDPRLPSVFTALKAE